MFWNKKDLRNLFLENNTVLYEVLGENVTSKELFVRFWHLGKKGSVDITEQLCDELHINRFGGLGIIPSDRADSYLNYVLFDKYGEQHPAVVKMLKDL